MGNAKYQYPAKLSVEIEREVIKDKMANPRFSLNALINKLLNKHYKLENK